MRSHLGLIAALCLSAGACGKKGAPLAPLVPIPAAVERIDATRLGSDVYVSLTIPAENVDKHTPADLERVEIYGYTGRSAPPRARWVELATLIASVPVAAAPLKPDGKPGRARTASDPPSNAPLQGAQVTVRDTLTPDELTQGRLPPVDPRAAVRDPQSAVRDPLTASGDPRTVDRGSRIAEAPLKRFYIGVPFNSKGRPGPPGSVAEFPLLILPDAPPAVTAQYTERTVILEWEPSGGLLGYLLDRPLPDEPPPFDGEEGSDSAVAAEPQGPVAYRVYREIPPDPLTPPGPSAATWNEEVPVSITPIPVPALTFTDNVELGRRRCYTVRAERGIGPEARTGTASPPACFTPTDTFPPAPPRSVTTVSAEGAISLIWEPNTELDLAGYVVLRGEAPGDTLRPVTKAPVPNAGYRDETVTPGTRYVYAVIAVDNRFPLPNMSPASETVEETAR